MTPRTSENTDPNNSCRPGGPDNNASLSKMLTAVHRKATTACASSKVCYAPLYRSPADVSRAENAQNAQLRAQLSNHAPRSSHRPAEKCVRHQGLRDPKVSRHAARAVECFTGASCVCRPERIGLARAGYESYRAGSQRADSPEMERFVADWARLEPTTTPPHSLPHHPRRANLVTEDDGLMDFDDTSPSKGKGKKRARDDEGEDEPEEEEVMQGDDRHKRRRTD
ncbi:hypothetical protein GGX14DRAFT_568334 [Mycena pura]|uniref:Uncharacterized protein n=1 Tax=Mycena pura TaxID=153505 RepID=A0AAD6V981_9AGAR|nr:hypothetical protein GGX14DRAFT_568334 [Mycena pura]